MRLKCLSLINYKKMLWIDEEKISKTELFVNLLVCSRTPFNKSEPHYTPSNRLFTKLYGKYVICGKISKSLIPAIC